MTAGRTRPVASLPDHDADAAPATAPAPLSVAETDAFIDRVLDAGARLYRDFPWRDTTDPYAVLLSEVMLQQTQTVRVLKHYPRWLRRFPTIDAVAAAATADVLDAWQGLGYNRRGLAFKRLADIVSDQYGGVLPDTSAELQALPGVGPATAAGVLAFAWDRHAPYLETNVRSVLLHELCPDRDAVPDRELRGLLDACCARAAARAISARTWNYALLDYGAHLKRTLPNPSRRSRHHTRQSPYQGSNRQKRARLLAAVLAEPGATAAHYAQVCQLDGEVTAAVLAELCAEGFLAEHAGRYSV
ncbi:MAG: adenine glycosylase [Actinomycetes bacterium]|jgi:A/G-specific adenine glycosylase|nr:adenine glycosylase [Actinomycetes bacterium]